jgi:hypothetical protein
LIKPAYDRLVEEPYWEGRSSSFRWTILVSGLIALGTIFALAIFRNDAFLVAKEAVELADLPGGSAAILELQRSLAQNASGRLGLIGAAVTFAIGGAICMSIGLAHARDWWAQHGSATDVKSVDGRYEDSFTAVTDLKAEIADMRIDLKRRNLDALLDEIAREEGIRRELAELAIRHRIDRITAVYHDGYEEGKASPEPVVRAYQGSTSGGTSASGPRRKRPYLRLRDDIRLTALDA